MIIIYKYTPENKGYSNVIPNDNSTESDIYLFITAICINIRSIINT